MRCYVIGLDGKVIAQRGTITGYQLGNGCTMLVAKDKPAEKKGEPSTAYVAGDTIPKEAIVSKEALLAFLAIPKTHLLTAIAYAPKA